MKGHSTMAALAILLGTTVAVLGASAAAIERGRPPSERTHIQSRADAESYWQYLREAHSMVGIPLGMQMPDAIQLLIVPIGLRAPADLPSPMNKKCLVDIYIRGSRESLLAVCESLQGIFDGSMSELIQILGPDGKEIAVYSALEKAMQIHPGVVDYNGYLATSGGDYIMIYSAVVYLDAPLEQGQFYCVRFRTVKDIHSPAHEDQTVIEADESPLSNLERLVRSKGNAAIRDCHIHVDDGWRELVAIHRRVARPDSSESQMLMAAPSTVFTAVDGDETQELRK
ncbi:MAG: hypothetical protein IT430_14930 [Phycisphaerales bacterium]|nr:hypothetical protein [Phycisphaerales bacterium]